MLNIPKSVQEIPLIRVDVPWIVGVLDHIDLVLHKGPPDLTPHQVRANFYALQSKIQDLFNHSILRPYLRTCYQQAVKLEEDLGKLAVVSDTNAEIDQLQLSLIEIQCSEFKTVFLAELTAAPIFLVLPKDNYDMSLLVDNGVGLFPSDMPKKAPETIIDAMEAGKALAYNLSTACGFHVFRVTESVLKRYWDHISSNQKRPKLETIGTFANVLEEKNFGKSKVWETLKQMAKLHRNPLIHPEVILTNDEAIEIIGIARSAIGTMLKTMPEIPPTTGSEVAALNQMLHQT